MPPGRRRSRSPFRIGICNYVDDASLNQIVENIQARLEEISAEKGVQFVIDYDNCNADATVMEQIIANFQSSGARSSRRRCHACRHAHADSHGGYRDARCFRRCFRPNRRGVLWSRWMRRAAT